MDDYNRINELIKQGYHLESYLSIKKINEGNIDGFMSVHNPEKGREFFLDPENENKYFFQFRDLKKKFYRIEIITDD